MINHARTLLLNSMQSDEPAPWERYIPEEFTTLELPDWLEVVRSTLVGTRGWWDKTFNVEQLLTVIASPRFNRYYDWMDDRTTEPQTLPFNFSYTDAVSSVDTTYYAGLVRRPVQQRVDIKREWTVRSLGGDGMRVVHKGTTISTELQSGGLLLAPDLVMTFNAPVPAGLVWNVTSYRKPENSILGTRLDLSNIPTSSLQNLFLKKYPGDEILDTYWEWVKEGQTEQMVAGHVLAYLWKATYLV